MPRFFLVAPSLACLVAALARERGLLPPQGVRGSVVVVNTLPGPGRVVLG